MHNKDIHSSLEQSEGCSLENNFKKIYKIKKINFNTLYHTTNNIITIEETKLQEWRKLSEYIDVLMNTYHDSDTLELDLTQIVDFYSLVVIFDFFDFGKIPKVSIDKRQTILNGLAYFGTKSDILNSIKKGYGLVWKLCNVDNQIKINELELKKKLENLGSLKYNLLNQEKNSLETNDTQSNEIYKDTIQSLKNMDNDLILNKNTYNELYETLYENYPVVHKLYETPSTQQKVYPEFDLSFIKQEFEKNSNNIFDNIPDCVVTGGMVSKHFTYNNYFIDTDYDVFLFADNQDRAFEIIHLIYNRLSSKLKTYILKTKNTITLYNSKFEVQIITKLYNNITDIFTSFDLDCCCVGYSNGVLYALPRFIRSLAYSGNIFDPDRQSPSYINRLKKYIKRGFTLYLPGLNKNDSDYNKDNYIIRKLREKTEKKANNSDYCDFFVFLKNRKNKEISELLENFHKKGKFVDTFEIKDINHIYDNKILNIDWNFNYKNKGKEDFFNDMYNCVYIR